MGTLALAMVIYFGGGLIALTRGNPPYDRELMCMYFCLMSPVFVFGLEALLHEIVVLAAGSIPASLAR